MNGQKYTKYLLDRGGIKILLHRLIYINHTLKYIEGPTIDFGCGVGTYLKYLPAGSIGYDINPSNVEECRRIGLDARIYDPVSDGYGFKDISPGQFVTFFMSHVLEHIDNAAIVFRRIIDSLNRLGIKKILIKVPGKKGFSFDETHRTFIGKSFFTENRLAEYNGYSLSLMKYFPFNLEVCNKIFTHNELIAMYDRNSF